MIINALKRFLTFKTHRIYNLPVLVMMPHSRCNCKCVMCDIWKANHEKRELTEDILRSHTSDLKKLGVREIVFSGGEALMHTNLWNLCLLLKSIDVRLTLLSTGLLVGRNADLIIQHLDGLIISIDGSESVHDGIRRIPNGFRKILEGVRSIKALKPNFPITARCVLQRQNFRDFENIVKAAHQARFDQISFLAADVSSTAFNRESPWDAGHISEVALSVTDVIEFESIIESSFDNLSGFYDSRFIAESPEKMRKLVRYYQAVNGLADYPAAVCNAPWVSAVLESDGSIQPCFFHKAYGNIASGNFNSLINSEEAISFRKSLKMDQDERCKKCVCSLKLGLTEML